MVEKSCSMSQGQPVFGARSAAMISISREMSLDGVMRRMLSRCPSRGQRCQPAAGSCPQAVSVEHRDNRLGEIVHAVFGQAGDVDAAVANHVDAVFGPKPLYLRLGEAEP